MFISAGLLSQLARQRVYHGRPQRLASRPLMMPHIYRTYATVWGPLGTQLGCRHAHKSISVLCHCTVRYYSTQQAPTPPAKSTGTSSVKTGQQETEPEAVSVGSIVQTVSRHLWPAGEPMLRLRVVSAVVLLFVAKLCNMAIPFLYKAIIDGLSTGTTTTSMFGLSCTAVVIIYGVTRLAASGSQELRNTVFIQVSQTALRKIATQVYAHIHNLDLNFHLNRKTGALTNVIERGTKGIGTLLSTFLFSLFPTFLELGMVCTVLWYSVGGHFAATAFVTVVIYMIFTTQVTVWRTAFRRRMNEMERAATQHAVDGLLNYESVKYFGNEKHEVERYNHYMQKYSRSAIAVQESLSFLNFGQQVIFGAALTAMMYMAAAGVMSGALTVGDLVMINTLLFQLSVPLNFLGGVYRELTQAVTDMENMFAVLNMKPLVTDCDDAVDYIYKGGKIEFRDVAFSYVPGKSLLQGVSFTIEPGTTVAFVGTSGCGKSTIFRLLYRFYDVEAGQILLDGQDIFKLRMASMRKYMGVVPQDTVLFNDTIQYNIKYGNLEANDNEVEHAADLAALTDAVSHMPKKLDTVVGERGLKLSGGEKQRVALARVFLKKPKILMCDEATSALDSGTEASIMQSLQNIRQQDTTMLVIAHRLSTIQAADKIIVLDQGHVVEQGTHWELLGKRGVYYTLWSTQQRTEKQLENPPTPTPTTTCP